MNKAGVAILIVGFVLVVIGVALAVVTQYYAESMSTFTKLMKPDQYDKYMALVDAGWAVAGVGALVVVVGLVTAVTAENRATTQTAVRSRRWQMSPGQSNAVNFCWFCGRKVSPGFALCPGCGSRLD